MSELMTKAFRAAMSPPPPCGLSLTALAACYGISKQALANIIRRHGLDLDYVAIPGLLHATLIHFGNASPMRRRLESIEERRRIAARIAEKQSQTKN